MRFKYVTILPATSVISFIFKLYATSPMIKVKVAPVRRTTKMLPEKVAGFKAVSTIVLNQNNNGNNTALKKIIFV